MSAKVAGEHPKVYTGRRFCDKCSMSVETKEILDRALSLPAREKAHIVDKLLSSLDEPDDAIDALWRKEVEGRIKAYDAGTLKSVSLEDVLAKYRK